MPRIAPLRKMFSRPVSSGWKPGADLEQAGDAAPDPDPAARRRGDLREDLQQRALARAVAADDAEDFAFVPRRSSRRRAPRTACRLEAASRGVARSSSRGSGPPRSRAHQRREILVQRAAADRARAGTTC